MMRISTLAALCFAAFLYVPFYEAAAGEDRASTAEERAVAALKALPEDARLSQALIAAYRNQRCAELPGLIEQGEESESLRPIVRFYRGVMYQFGICAPQDWALAADAYRSAAILGEPTSQLRLGRLYLEGLGVEQDRRKARKWFKRLMYGMLSKADDKREAWLRKDWGTYELPEILLEELAWLRRVEGDPRSRMRIAVKILAGEGLPRDVKAVEKWIRSAADAGLPEAAMQLAHWLIAGEFEEYFEHEGVNKIYRVATAGYLPAMLEMAMRHIEGDGVRKSDALAYPWLLRAKWAGAPVDELQTAVGARLTGFTRKLAENDARNAKYLLIAFD